MIDEVRGVNFKQETLDERQARECRQAYTLGCWHATQIVERLAAQTGDAATKAWLGDAVAEIRSLDARKALAEKKQL